MFSTKVVLAVLAFSSPALAQNSIGCGVTGTCTLGFEITSLVDNGDEFDCLLQCKSPEYPSCQYYTFYPDLNICYLWETCPSLDENCGNCLSGDVECAVPPERLCYLEGACSGTAVLSPQAANSPQQCVSQCAVYNAENPTVPCNWWTFRDTGSSTFCQLFFDCQVNPTNCAQGQTCIFGYESCSSTGTTGATGGTETTPTGVTGTTVSTTTTGDGNYQCGDTIDGATSGIITSPNYPSDYPPDTNCEFTILNGDTTKRISFRITDLQLEECCGCDYLNVYDGPSSASDLLASYCFSSNYSYPILSSTDRMFVRFHSDGSGNAAGFRAVFEELQSFEMGTDSDNGEFQTGTLTSSGYPGQYENSANDEFLISVESGAAVGFRFTDLDMESCCDSLSIYDGSDASGTLIGEFTGTGFDPNLIYTSSSNNMFFLFDTDSSVTRTGFSGQFSALN